MIVTLAFMPGRVVGQFAVNGDRTVRALLGLAGIGEATTQTNDVRIGSEPATLDSLLEEGDTVYLVKRSVSGV